MVAREASAPQMESPVASGRRCATPGRCSQRCCLAIENRHNCWFPSRLSVDTHAAADRSDPTKCCRPVQRVEHVQRHAWCYRTAAQSTQHALAAVWRVLFGDRESAQLLVSEGFVGSLRRALARNCVVRSMTILNMVLAGGVGGLLADAQQRCVVLVAGSRGQRADGSLPRPRSC